MRLTNKKKIQGVEQIELFRSYFIIFFLTKHFFINFQHDPENNKACVPGGDDGNYIMFARATSGDKKNNRNFSPCSLKSIKPVLLAKARGPKGCFKGNFRAKLLKKFIFI